MVYLRPAAAGHIGDGKFTVSPVQSVSDPTMSGVKSVFGALFSATESTTDDALGTSFTSWMNTDTVAELLKGGEPASDAVTVRLYVGLVS